MIDRLALAVVIRSQMFDARCQGATPNVALGDRADEQAARAVEYLVRSEGVKAFNVLSANFAFEAPSSRVIKVHVSDQAFFDVES